MWGMAQMTVSVVNCDTRLFEKSVHIIFARESCFFRRVPCKICLLRLSLCVLRRQYAMLLIHVDMVWINMLFFVSLTKEK